FPEQGFCSTKLLFCLTPAPGKRVRTGELHAGLEACAVRVRGMVDHAKEQRFVSEEAFAKHTDALGIDLRSMIEHELRTPLASVTGYIALLEHLEGDDLINSFQEYRDVIKEQSNFALEALEKLGMTLQSGESELAPIDVVTFDPAQEIERLCLMMKKKASDYVTQQAAERTAVHFRQDMDVSCILSASPRLFRWALWE